MIEVLDPEPHDAALNMAIDEALLHTATAPTLRIYRWVRPAVSFGYFGKWTDAAQAASHREIVRRWTGGGIVPHGDDVTYSLIVPRAHPFFGVSPRESYCAIHERIAAALGDAILAATVAPQTSHACFENPVLHDVLMGSRKVAGAAQRRNKCGLLHQGSIQIAGDPDRIANAFATRRSSVPLSADILDSALRLSREKYANETWTQRR